MIHCYAPHAMQERFLDSAELYEAIVDDEAFAALPLRIARQFGSRSALIHWLDHSGRSHIDVHSNYFSSEQMANYAANFVAADLWTQAAAAIDRRNIAWNAADLVAPERYAESVFYNEWIRPMGDDTFHCAGVVMETEHGLGILGLHRGRTQQEYDPRVIAALNRLSPDLRRALTIRAKLTERIGPLRSWQQAFDDSPVCSMIIDRLGTIRQSNGRADNFIGRNAALTVRDRRIVLRGDHKQREWNLLLARATAAFSPAAGQGVFGIGRAVWLAEFLPIVEGTLAGCALVSIIDRSDQARSGTAIRSMMQNYSLTSTETEIAIQLAEGLTPDEIAARRGTSIQTVRSQLKQVMSKTGSRRQVDVVALVLKLTLA